jgi:hypothetical protein
MDPGFPPTQAGTPFTEITSALHDRLVSNRIALYLSWSVSWLLSQTYLPLGMILQPI